MATRPVSNTLRRLAKRLFSEPADQDTLIASLMEPAERPTAVVWTGDRPQSNPFQPHPSVVWQPEWVDLVPFSQRPGRHVLHDQGAIYCLDPSSVFEAQVLTAVPTAQKILDLCASPGGKSVLAWRRFAPQTLLCNEVIGKRTAALIANLRRCRIHPSMVCSQDSAPLADAVGAAADLVIVDAPCSGQSLLARGKKSPGCFHPATINMNANRQRRILANACRLVAPGGYLAYMTCTYSLKENERNLEWLLKRIPRLQPVEVPLLSALQSHYSDIPCYRLWPFASVGAGGFAALLQNTSEEPAAEWRDPALVWSSDRQ